jgi:hypothetical protein
MIRFALTASAATVLATVLAMGAAPAIAHHSRANFDLQSEITIDGVVTEYSWKNPHGFVVVETTEADGSVHEWTFELNATPILTRFGTTPDSLKPGDHVLARGNPDRNPDRRFVYALNFTKDDGTDVWSWGKPADPAAAPTAPAQIVGSTDFTGVWRIIFERDVLGADRPDTELHTTLPVNEKGQQLVDNFDPDRNPEWDCLPQSMPQILGYPYPFEITREDESTLKILYEVNHVERLIHLDETEIPADAPRDPRGYSIGRFDADGSLVIDTARFSHVVWGLGEGVDSGEQKTLREVYRLTEEGRRLELEITMEDPEYLREPVTITHRYNLTPGYEIQDYYCDPVTSRRHLTAGTESE